MPKSRDSSPISHDSITSTILTNDCNPGATLDDSLGNNETRNYNDHNETIDQFGARRVDHPAFVQPEKLDDDDEDENCTNDDEDEDDDLGYHLEDYYYPTTSSSANLHQPDGGDNVCDDLDETHDLATVGDDYQADDEQQETVSAIYEFLS